MFRYLLQRVLIVLIIRPLVWAGTFGSFILAAQYIRKYIVPQHW